MISATALVAAVYATLATLPAQHGTLERGWLPGEPLSLHAARIFAAKLLRVRGAMLAYARATPRALRDPAPNDTDLALPF